MSDDDVGREGEPRKSVGWNYRRKTTLKSEANMAYDVLATDQFGEPCLRFFLSPYYPTSKIEKWPSLLLV
jgi:hypothetical protein